MSPTPIQIAFASDEVTAMPMGVAIASLLATRDPATRLDIHVLSCGITRRSQARVADTVATLGQGAATLHWHAITGANATLLQRFYTDSTRPYPPANYARLLVGHLLPPDASRVIYLDIDTVALTDLTPLWDIPFDGAAALAIRDLPHDAGQTARLLATISAEEQTRFGLTPETVYFQAGVLVLDLAALRAGLVDDITGLLQRYPGLTFPDQDALNVTLAARRRLIDPRWNSMTAIYWDGEGAAPPYDPEMMQALREAPFVVHYSGRPKPWEPGCTHPLADHWRRFFAMTPWAGQAETALTRARDRIPRARRVIGKRLRRMLGL